MLSQRQFERYQMSRYLKEWRESEWDKVARFLLTAHMWRNYGRWDYRFKSAKEFEDWLEIAHSHERKFEEIVKV